MEKNGSVFEYLETMSKIIVNEKPDAKAGKKKRGSRKPESFVQAITEKLKKHSDGENYICVPSGEILPDLVYYFSCGHWHSGRTLQDGFRLFDRISDTLVTDKLLKLYDLLDKSKCADVSCPSCLYNYIKQ